MGVHDTEMYPAIRKLLGMPEDEPFFIFRAQDKNSPSVLMAYEHACSGAGCGLEHMARIGEARKEFTKWQTKHSLKVKVPD